HRSARDPPARLPAKLRDQHNRHCRMRPPPPWHHRAAVSANRRCPPSSLTACEFCPRWCFDSRKWSAFARDIAGLRQSGLRSEEHTSELQSRGHLVCRLLLEKKKKNHRKLPYAVREDVANRPRATSSCV